MHVTATVTTRCARTLTHEQPVRAPDPDACCDDASAASVFEVALPPKRAAGLFHMLGHSRQTAAHAPGGAEVAHRAIVDLAEELGEDELVDHCRSLFGC